MVVCRIVLVSDVISNVNDPECSCYPPHFEKQYGRILGGMYSSVHV